MISSIVPIPPGRAINASAWKRSLDKCYGETFVLTSTLHIINRSLILPYISYGIVVKGQAAKADLSKTLKLQKPALWLRYFGQYVSHINPFFHSANILPINMLYFKSVSILMHDVSNNLVPLNTSNLFTSSNQVHNYKTRFSSRENYHVKYSSLDKVNLFQELELGYGITFLLSYVNCQKAILRKIKHYFICFCTRMIMLIFQL